MTTLPTARPTIAFALTYIALVLTANLMTSHLGLLPTGFGLMVTAGTFAAGLVIAVRNPLQEVGGRRWVIACIVVGAALSWWLGSGRIAIASGVTFLIAETLDMTIYTWLRKRGWVSAALAGIVTGAVADNGCFSAHGNFDTDRWLDWLTRLVAGREHRCLFAVAPDVFNPDLGDDMGETSLRYSRMFLCDVRALGIPVALVAQNGLTPDMVPWDEIDWIFLGGTTEWKIGRAAAQLTAAAREHGKRVHMGRVNSARRWAIAEVFGCDTADGTFLAFGPDTNLPRMQSWWEHDSLFTEGGAA